MVCGRAVGRAGGILTFWDEKKFTCISAWNVEGAIIVNGWWKATSDEVCIINVYAPCCREGKASLWDRLGMVVTQVSGVGVCLVGDFNSIIDPRERVGLGWRVSLREIFEFREFIEKNGLTDLELQRRKYSWYRCNGTSKSRIDRALINEKWMERWSETGLRGLPRTISDHCAIIL